MKIKFWGVTAALMYGIVLTACGGGGNTNPNPTYTVTYDGNGGSGGSIPIDTTNYQVGQTVTVLANTGNLVKIGYSFSGWNTQANGSGTTYTQAQTLTMGSVNVTLFAKWTANPTYTVTYDGNGNTGGSVPVDSTYYEQGQIVTVLGNSGNLTRDGYSFAGWNTQPDGNGTNYLPGQTYGLGVTVLYAKWTANPTNTVTYDGNGNAGGSVPVDSTHYEQGQTVTVLGNTGNLTRAGYTFAGWSTQPDGDGTTYWQGDTFILGSANVTLFAKWEAYPWPRPNAEAEQLSIEATGALTAPQVVYDRVVTELASIRAAYPSTANITMMPSWNFQHLILGFTDTGKTAVQGGSYTDWNALNYTYAVTNIDKSLLDSFGAVNLTFSRRYNIPLLVLEYTGLTDVRYAEPNGRIGDGNDVCLSINGGNHFFIFDAASGDCLAGCTQHTYQGFVVAENGGIYELGTWDTSSGYPEPAWLTELSACMAWGGWL